MKLVNKLLRFAQLLAALALIAGYFLHEQIWNLVLELGIDVSFDFVVNGFLAIIAFVVASVPVRYIIEKIVESKFLL